MPYQYVSISKETNGQQVIIAALEAYRLDMHRSKHYNNILAHITSYPVVEKKTEH